MGSYDIFIDCLCFVDELVIISVSFSLLVEFGDNPVCYYRDLINCKNVFLKVLPLPMTINKNLPKLRNTFDKKSCVQLVYMTLKVILDSSNFGLFHREIIR